MFSNWLLIRRTVLPLSTSPNNWRRARWIADAAARVVVTAHEGWPFITGAAGDAAVSALFEGAPFDDGRGIHRHESLRELVAFFTRLLAEAPPPIDDYRAWYRALRALWRPWVMSSRERCSGSFPRISRASYPRLSWKEMLR